MEHAELLRLGYLPAAHDEARLVAPGASSASGSRYTRPYSLCVCLSAAATTADVSVDPAFTRTNSSSPDLDV